MSSKAILEQGEKGRIDILGTGYYWEEMFEGQQFRTYTRTVTESDLVSFVTLTGMYDSGFLDRNHIGQMAARPVPGALTYSIVEGFIVQSFIRGTGIAMLECVQEAVSPVSVNDTIWAILKITAIKRVSKGRAIVDSLISIYNQEDNLVFKYTSKRMIAGRPSVEGLK